MHNTTQKCLWHVWTHLATAFCERLVLRVNMEPPNEKVVPSTCVNTLSRNFFNLQTKCIVIIPY